MLAVTLLLLAQAGAVDLATLRYIDLQPGTGATASPGQKYTVHYTGRLTDGTKFDSSVDRNEPFEFVQGRRQVIAGWEAGFEGMKVGGKHRLFIPYQFAYGEKGRGPIPPKAGLIFEVELLKVSDVPETPAAADLILPLSDLESKVLALARAVPADKYEWRPGPGIRSFGEVLLHIVYGNRLLLNIAIDDPKPDALKKQIEENAKNEKQKIDKDAIIQMLNESFQTVRKSLEEARAGALARDVQFFGRATTQRGVLTFLDVHLAEHTGQAIAYARMIGIVPPWSN
jgi:uncharacterized damage-inducible protein DinB